jgi:glycosyltransferase involved in cell wall biosynthesis
MNGEPLRVLIVCQGDLAGASEKQALGFAEQLAQSGHEVMLSLRGDPATAAREGAGGVPGLSVRFHAFRGPRLRAADLDAARSFAPQLVHSFNARHVTLTAARAYADATNGPLCCHWEDDEWSIRGGYGRRSLPRRVARLGRRVLAPLAPGQGVFVTPRSLAWVRANAAGHDALTPALAARVQELFGRDCAVVLPITPDTRAAAADPPALPAAVDGHTLVGLTGEIHPGSVEDLELALTAVAQLQRRGRKVALVHAGKVLPRFDAEQIARDAGAAPGTAVFLGYLPFAQIPPLLERLDILVQPGRPSDYNRLRLPSKMQAYLLSGTPTVTFAVGFAELLADGEEVLKLQGFDAAELADRLELIIADPDLAARLATGARAAAERLFDRERNGDALVAHYRTVLAALPEPALRR